MTQPYDTLETGAEADALIAKLELELSRVGLRCRAVVMYDLRFGDVGLQVDVPKMLALLECLPAGMFTRLVALPVEHADRAWDAKHESFSYVNLWGEMLRMLTTSLLEAKAELAKLKAEKQNE